LISSPETLAVEAVFREALRDARGNLRAHVGGDQKFFEFIERVRVDLALGRAGEPFAPDAKTTGAGLRSACAGT
jgi:hypothetical protein